MVKFLLVLVLLVPGSGSPHPIAGDGDQPSRIIFVGGQHHGGTSLVHALLATDPEIAFLNATHVFESEGQHLQQIWPTVADRNDRHCVPFSKSLCLLKFTSLLAKDSSASAVGGALARIEASWAPFWACDAYPIPCAYGVEKDPDLGSLLFKAAIFPSTTIVAVMRHPLALANYDGYARSKHPSNEASLARWNAVWPFFLASIDQVAHSYAVVRYEALIYPGASEQLMATGKIVQHGRRLLDFRGDRLKHPVIDSQLIWAWVNDTSSAPLGNQLALWFEHVVFELTGYSLQSPQNGSKTSLYICSDTAPCHAPAFVKLASELETALGVRGFDARERLWASSYFGRAANATTSATGVQQVAKEDMSKPRRYGTKPKDRAFRPHNFVDLIPEAHTGVCVCAKCGSTSFWHRVYSVMFNRDWEYNVTRPWVQEVSPRWEDRRAFATIEQEHALFRSPGESHGSKPDPYTFALIREPRARLISAWKSKFACRENKTGVDGASPAELVPRLCKLAGVVAPPEQCLSVRRFLELLLMVHRAGKAGWLDPHVRPQTSDCFSRYAPGRWSRVAVITDQEALDELASQLSPGSNWTAVHAHASPSASRAPPDVMALRPPLWGGVHVAQLLEELTAMERALLWSYLPTALP